MLFKLAVRNVRRQVGSYLIYFITVMLTVATVFAVNNMIFSDVVTALQGMMADFVRPLLVMLSVVLAAIMAFVLAYATTFLLRRRKKEFGLYLTLGFSRGNILSLFAGETALTFLVSLAAGSLLGFGLYYGLIEVFTGFIEWPYAPGGCTWEGSGLTLVMVAGVFLLASAFSLGYLRFAKISALLAGEGRVEKKVRLPWLWPFLAAAALAAGIFACVGLVRWIASSDFSLRVGEMGLYVAMLLAALLLFPAALCHCGALLLQRRDCCRSKGLGRVTLRHISARLGASSVMVGMLAVLLTFAVIGPNAFLSYRTVIERQVQIDYPFDVVANNTEYTGVSYEEGVAVLEEYVEVAAQCSYTRYSGSKQTGSGYLWMFYVCESDFRALCALLGYTLPDLGGGLLRCEDAYSLYGRADVGQFSYQEGVGQAEGYIGTLICPPNMLSLGTNCYEWTVVPDALLEEVLSEYEYVYSDACFAAELKQERYDALAAFDALIDLTDHLVSFNLREAARLKELGTCGLFFLATLFLSVVFFLLSAALLALKALSLVAEDKPRYRILWRLGASEGRMQRSLFAQLAFFFLAPFAVALVMNVPLLAFLSVVWEGNAVFSLGQAVGTAAAFSAAMLGVLFVYLMAAFFVSWQDIRRNIRSEGRL